MHNSSLLDVEERVMLLDAGEFGPILFFLFLHVLSFEDFANAFFFSCAAFLKGLHSPSSLTLNDLPISLEDSLRKFKFSSVERQRLSKRSQDISTDLPIRLCFHTVSELSAHDTANHPESVCLYSYATT